MKRICVFLTLFAASFVVLQAQESKLRVAVFDPSAAGNIIDNGTKTVVREIISSVFVNTGNYIMVERSALDKVMKEQAFSNSGAVDDNQATELGRLAGANKVVLSVITQTGSRSMLSIKMIDVESATIDKQKAKVVNSDVFLDEIEPLTRSLLGETVEEVRVVITNTSPSKENYGSAHSSDVSDYAQTSDIYSSDAAVLNIINMIDRACKNPRKYKTDEERFKSLSDSRKEPIEQFIVTNSKSPIEPTSVRDDEAVFFLRARGERTKVGYSLLKVISVKKVNDVLLLFMDGQLIGFGTATTGFLVRVQREKAMGRHILSLHSSSFSLLDISVNISNKNYYLLDWDGKKDVEIVN
ncbi:MAG: CsgG/HfaB family protein [Prevotellaceae bacterium]|jgi:hypothetical protein|nr:CsgG/HfaB family protein [Prevotellaceae bacterium]